MKKCRKCNRTFSDDTLSFCHEDGSLLSPEPDSEDTTVLGNGDNAKPVEERLHRILRSLVGDERFITRLEEVSLFDEEIFELRITFLASPMFGEHRTFLRFSEFCEGEKLSLGFEHIWGWFDSAMPASDLVGQMIEAFRKNTFGWQSSNLFLGMREFQGADCLTLNCSDCFLTKWSDDDMRELLGQRISDIGSAFMTYDPSLTAFRNNWEPDDEPSADSSTNVASWIETEDPKIVEMFNNASDLQEQEKWDYAISLYNQCLMRNPEPTLSLLAWFELAKTIRKKFRSALDRQPEEWSNYECRWCWRSGLCAQQAVKIYEKNRSLFTEEGFDELYENAKRLEQGLLGGAVQKDSRGELEYRDFQAVGRTPVERLDCVDALEKSLFAS